MIDTIKDCLNSNKKISNWVIKKETKNSKELFFIKKKLDMNRAVSFTEYKVKIFVDFEENAEKYTGDVVFTIGASDSKEDIAQKTEFAVKQALYVKNKAYPLYDNHSEKYAKTKSESNIQKLIDNFDKFAELINHDYSKDGIKSGINSLELFVVDTQISVLSSLGTDVSYDTSNVTFELVTDNNEGKESVEIFDLVDVRDFDTEKIGKMITEQLKETDQRSEAKKCPQMKKTKVILSNDAVQQLLKYYLDKSTDRLIFMKMSNYEVGKKLQSENANSKITLKAVPMLANAVHQQLVDPDGIILGEKTLIQDGVVKNVMAGSKIGHYLGLPVTGYTDNFTVDAGDKSESELRTGEYLEIKTFSDFLTDNATGDFGGEFRLAIWYKDGVQTPVSGGSLSLNLNRIQDKMLFSKELKERSYSKAPSVIVFEDVSVAGEQ